MLLLVGKVMLGASNDTSFLNTLDCLVYCDTREHWVRREAFPVATTGGVSADRTNGRAKLDIDALLAMFDAHVVTTEVEQITIPCRANGHSGRESGNVVGEAHAQRRVLQAERLETESWNGTSVADTLLALPTNSGGQVDLLEESELGDELPGLSISTLPVA